MVQKWKLIYRPYCRTHKHGIYFSNVCILNNFTNCDKMYMHKCICIGDSMIVENYEGYFVSVDGPNGAGKSTLIEHLKYELKMKGYPVYVTKEPTDSILGNFVREYAEHNEGISLACLVAADRYEHIQSEIMPMLKKGYIVISDRYILSSLILQCMDNVDVDFILSINSQIILPNLQIALYANSDVLQERLLKRDTLTRFEKGNSSKRELTFMVSAVEKMKKMGVDVMCIDNTSNLEEIVGRIISHISTDWSQ